MAIPISLRTWVFPLYRAGLLTSHLLGPIYMHPSKQLRKQIERVCVRLCVSNGLLLLHNPEYDTVMEQR